MARRKLLLLGLLSLFAAQVAAATELDRVREFERAREAKRQALESSTAEQRKLEAERITAQAGRITRNGAELEIKLDNGARTFFRNEESHCLEGVIPTHDDSCVEFVYLGRLEQRFDLLLARYYEGLDYRLIVDANGRAIRLADVPHFSPDADRFVAVSSPEAFSFDGIEVWSVRAGTPVMEWNHQPKGYALYFFGRWNGDDAIALEVETYVAHELKRLPARLVRQPGGWRLEGPAEASH
ncbi:MAG TPA: hypothetical protein VEU47_01580 [Candidatus Cybelea sp.]|nr:hypothetical protein [Candidatus Cybelea sp.]